MHPKLHSRCMTNVDFATPLNTSLFMCLSVPLKLSLFKLVGPCLVIELSPFYLFSFVTVIVFVNN